MGAEEIVSRYARKVDANQAQIVATLRKLGLTVLHLHTVGAGIADLAVGHGGITSLAEVKTEKGKLTPAQEKTFSEWTGGVKILRNEQDCIDLRNQLLRWHKAINREQT